MGRCRCSLLVSEDETFEKRIQQALQEIIAHKESKAKDDDFQATFNRIILKFPVLRVRANRIPAAQRWRFPAAAAAAMTASERAHCPAASTARWRSRLVRFHLSLLHTASPAAARDRLHSRGVPHL
jgi:hypothetical protein